MSSELRVDRIVPVDGVSAGSGNSPATSFVGGGGVIQVQMGASENSQYISDNNSWRTTGLNVNITPKFATSKILVQAFVSFGGKNNAYIQFKLQRNSTDIMIHTDSGAGSEVTGGGVILSLPNSVAQYATQKEAMMAFDSPNTTSTVNYSVLWRLSNWTSGQVAYTNRAYTLGDDNQMRTTSQIVAMEVSA